MQSLGDSVNEYIDGDISADQIATSTARGLPGAGGPRRRTLLDQLSSNPSGSQTFYTDARGAIYNDGSGGGSVQYFWFHTISPSQNY